MAKGRTPPPASWMPPPSSKPRSRSPARKGGGRGKYDRSKSKRQRKDEQRRALLDAAITVFGRAGYGAASVEQVLVRAGLSRATFYAHFSGLEELLVGVFDHVNAEFFRALEQRLEAIADPVERLRAGIGDYLTLLAGNAEVAVVVQREIAAAGPAHAFRRHAARARFADLLVSGLAGAHARGLVAQPPDEAKAYALVCAIEGLGMRYVERGEADRAVEATTKLVDLVLGAFGHVAPVGS